MRDLKGGEGVRRQTTSKTDELASAKERGTVLPGYKKANAQHKGRSVTKPRALRERANDTLHLID